MTDDALRMIVSDMIRIEYEDEATDGVLPPSNLYGLAASIIGVVRSALIGPTAPAAAPSEAEIAAAAKALYQSVWGGKFTLDGEPENKRAMYLDYARCCLVAAAAARQTGGDA